MPFLGCRLLLTTEDTEITEGFYEARYTRGIRLIYGEKYPPSFRSPPSLTNPLSLRVDAIPKVTLIINHGRFYRVKYICGIRLICGEKHPPSFRYLPHLPTLLALGWMPFLRCRLLLTTEDTEITEDFYEARYIRGIRLFGVKSIPRLFDNSPSLTNPLSNSQKKEKKLRGVLRHFAPYEIEKLSSDVSRCEMSE